jgi:2-amino-4-hydroxy-6-hydroxymethyldihydropteridine diphosphokinase
MKRKETIYLSLGSNLGSKLNNLQKAVLFLGRDIGRIVCISPVYKTVSWGFEGDFFLNACIALETGMNPEAVLQAILNIETAMGRRRKEEEGYHSRIIDIDLLYYGEEVIESTMLRVPHPRLEQRRFVLKPLSDIAPQFYHPVLHKDTRNLLQECRDKTRETKLTVKLYPSREKMFADLHFIAIEGNIGAGKTSLSRMIAEEYNAKLILERFADNPFLPKFYDDPARFAFPLEMSFLAERYQQFTDDTSQFDLFRSFMVSDYDIFKSLIFAKVTLQQEEFVLYRKVFDFMYREVKKPGLYVYLYQTTERLMHNIRKRGRDYERNIQSDYLDKINRGYMDYIKGLPEPRRLILNLGPYDFVENDSDFEKIMSVIQEHIMRDDIR